MVRLMTSIQTKKLVGGTNDSFRPFLLKWFFRKIHTIIAWPFCEEKINTKVVDLSHVLLLPENIFMNEFSGVSPKEYWPTFFKAQKSEEKIET